MPVAKGSFRIAFEDFLKSFDLSKGINTELDKILERYEDEMFSVLSSLFGDLGISQNLPDVLKPIQGQFGGGKHPVILPLLIGLFSGVAGNYLGNVAAPVFGAAKGIANYAAPTNPLPFEFVLKSAIWNNNIDPEHIKWSRINGYDEARFKEMLSLSYNQLSPEIAMALLNRGLIDTKIFESILHRNGYDQLGLDAFEELRHVIPPLSDLIRMSVREAFNEDAVRRFELDANYPKDVEKFASAQGLSPEWVQRYWRAHWELPSIQQGFEMFQRLRPSKTSVPFTADDLQSLMITKDIPKFFRQRLLEIAYNPITRVDIRRFYQMGVLNLSQVEQRNLDLGYSPEDAKVITKFIELDAIDEGSQLTKATIISAFKKGLFPRDTAKQELTEIGFAKDIAELYIELAEFELEVDRRDKEIDWIVVQYVEGVINEPDMIGRLNALRLPVSQLQTALFEARRKRLQRLVLPDKNDLINFYKAGVMGDADFTSKMLQKGFTLDSIAYYIRMMNKELTADKIKELERAAKENKRIQNEAIATQYQKQLAILDEQIAENELQIANLKVARSIATEPRVIESIEDEIVKNEAEIRELRLRKAQIKVR